MWANKIKVAIRGLLGAVEYRDFEFARADIVSISAGSGSENVPGFEVVSVVPNSKIGAPGYLQPQGTPADGATILFSGDISSKYTLFKKKTPGAVSTPSNSDLKAYAAKNGFSPLTIVGDAVNTGTASPLFRIGNETVFLMENAGESASTRWFALHMDQALAAAWNPGDWEPLPLNNDILSPYAKNTVFMPAYYMNSGKIGYAGVPFVALWNAFTVTGGNTATVTAGDSSTGSQSNLNAAYFDADGKYIRNDAERVISPGFFSTTKFTNIPPNAKYVVLSATPAGGSTTPLTSDFIKTVTFSNEEITE